MGNRARTWRLASCALASLALAAHAGASAPALHFDGLLRGGLVVDGSGQAAYRADVAWRDGRIAAIGDLRGATAKLERDVTGLVVTPGFIDVHSHADEDLIWPQYRAAPAMIRQGVTLAVFGIDGGTDPEDSRVLRQKLQRDGVGVNHMTYVGHNGVRARVLGEAARAPAAAELDAMRARVRMGMEDGAVGLSTGLMYLPGRHAAADEVIALAKVAAEFGGVYDSHDRNPAFDLLGSVAECLDTGRQAGLEAHVAHLKAVGRKNFGKAQQLITQIEAAQLQSPVSADIYPYDGAAARLVMEILVPPAGWAAWASIQRLEDPALPEAERGALIKKLAAYWQRTLADPKARARTRAATEHPPPYVYSWVTAVGYDSFRIVSSARPELVGRMIVDLATERRVEPFDVLVELVQTEGARAKVTLGAIQEEEVRALLRRPWMMVASDGREGGLQAGSGHPRFRGSFARILGRYVREWQVLTLTEAVHKMSGQPAAYLRLTDRGVLRPGAAADIAVFDPARVIDRSTWDDPQLYAEGFQHVMVNGTPALLDGQATGALAGRFVPFDAGARPVP
jgi:N-acyl-D-amino-acid deacylase